MIILYTLLMINTLEEACVNISAQLQTNSACDKMTIVVFTQKNNEQNTPDEGTTSAT